MHPRVLSFQKKDNTLYFFGDPTCGDPKKAWQGSPAPTDPSLAGIRRLPAGIEITALQRFFRSSPPSPARRLKARPEPSLRPADPFQGRLTHSQVTGAEGQSRGGVRAQGAQRLSHGPLDGPQATQFCLWGGEGAARRPKGRRCKPDPTPATWRTRGGCREGQRPSSCQAVRPGKMNGL